MARVRAGCEVWKPNDVGTLGGKPCRGRPSRALRAHTYVTLNSLQMEQGGGFSHVVDCSHSPSSTTGNSNTTYVVYACRCVLIEEPSHPGDDEHTARILVKFLSNPKRSLGYWYHSTPWSLHTKIHIKLNPTSCDKH